MSEENEAAEAGEDDSGDETLTETAAGIGSEISATVSKLGAGEKLAVLGAAAVMGGWLLFDLLIDEYSIGQFPFALALVAVTAAYLHHNKGSEGWAVDYRTVLLTVTALLGVIGVWFFIEEARNGRFDDDVATVIGALIFYAGSIVSGVGAWQLKSTS